MLVSPLPHLLSTTAAVLSSGLTSLGVLFFVCRDDPPFDADEVAPATSLMNASSMGSLSCICQPTDPAEPQNDRRRSCRACGHAMVNQDALRLYEPLTRRQIRRTIRDLARAAAQMPQVHQDASQPNLVRASARIR
jgi:hypothetical protein